MLMVILQIFLHLLEKHFGRNYKCHKIFNWNNGKISCSCIDNIKDVISSHKKEIRNFYNEMNGKKCSCRNKNSFPLDNKWENCV